MSNAFEYGDALLSQPAAKMGDEENIENEKAGLTPRPRIESNQPYLNLATLVPILILAVGRADTLHRFRMVVLADEILESFFETDLSASFRLERPVETEFIPPSSSSGLLGDLWSTIATDSNKKIFNMFTDEIGKTIGKHQVIHIIYSLDIRC